MAIKKMEYSEQARTLKANGASDDLIARNRAVQESLFAVINRETDSKIVQDEFTSIITEFFKGSSEEERKITGISEESLPAIMRALKAGGNKNHTVKELPDLNHLLQTAETGNISEYGKIEETMSPTALQIIGDWILEQTGF